MSDSKATTVEMRLAEVDRATRCGRHLDGREARSGRPGSVVAQMARYTGFRQEVRGCYT